jgi:hypothetical protein
MKAAIANIGRPTGEVAGSDEEVWLTWSPDATIVLTR